MCSVPMCQDELRKAIVGIQTDSTIDEGEKAARRQALLTGKWRPGDGQLIFSFFDWFDEHRPSLPLFLSSFYSCSSLHSDYKPRLLLRSWSPLCARRERKFEGEAEERREHLKESKDVVDVDDVPRSNPLMPRESFLSLSRSLSLCAAFCPFFSFLAPDSHP